MSCSESLNITDVSSKTKDYGSWFSNVVEPKEVSPEPTNIFDMFSKLTNDPFWKELFCKAAENRFPKYFRFVNNYLIYKRNRIRKKIYLDTTETIVDLCKASISFFRENGKIFSPRDEENSMIQHDVCQKYKEDKEEKWSDFNQRGKDILINDYVSNMQKKMNLTPLQALNLHEIIELSIKGVVKEDNELFNIKNGKIVSLNGIFYKKDESRFVSDHIKSIKIMLKDYTFLLDSYSEEKDTKPQFTTKWKKFSCDIEQKLGRKNEKTRKQKSRNFCMSEYDSPHYDLGSYQDI